MGRGEEDNLSSISATNRREQRVGFECGTDSCTVGGSKEEAISEYDFCVNLQSPEGDVFLILD